MNKPVDKQAKDQSTIDRFGLTPEDYDDLYSSIDQSMNEPWWNN